MKCFICGKDIDPTQEPWDVMGNSANPRYFCAKCWNGLIDQAAKSAGGGRDPRTGLKPVKLPEENVPH